MNTIAGSRQKRSAAQQPLDHEAIEEKFEPDYVLDTHGTVILFRAKVVR